MNRLKRLIRAERGITGLETAIILIAFVVVAAVFAYTVISAGMFATQKSQESVHSGLKEAQGGVELKGATIGTNGTIRLGVWVLHPELGWLLSRRGVRVRRREALELGKVLVAHVEGRPGQASGGQA